MIAIYDQFSEFEIRQACLIRVFESLGDTLLKNYAAIKFNILKLCIMVLLRDYIYTCTIVSHGYERVLITVYTQREARCYNSYVRESRARVSSFYFQHQYLR